MKVFHGMKTFHQDISTRLGYYFFSFTIIADILNFRCLREVISMREFFSLHLIEYSLVLNNVTSTLGVSHRYSYCRFKIRSLSFFILLKLPFFFWLVCNARKKTIQEKSFEKSYKKTILDNSFLLRALRLPSSGRLPLEVFSVIFLSCIF